MTDLDALAALAAAATPGPWYDQTVGHRSIRQAAGAVTRALFVAPLPSCTDLSWVYTDGPNICLTGNGPTSVENAAYIAAADPTTVLALLARLYVPTPADLDDLMADISATGYASEAVEVVEEWTRKRWGVVSAMTTAMNARRR